MKELKQIEKNEMELARQMSLKEQEDRDKLLELEEERMLQEALKLSE